MPVIYIYIFLMLSGFCGGMLYPTTLMAAQLNVTAEYKPASYEPSGATFVSTTTCVSPWSSLLMPGVCDGSVSSLDFITTSVAMPTISRTALGDSVNPKDAFFYYKIPSEKDFTVRAMTGAGSGRTFPVKFIPRSLGTMHIGSSMLTPVVRPAYQVATGNGMSGCRRQGSTAIGGAVTWAGIQTMFYMQPGTSCSTNIAAGSQVDFRHQNIFLGFTIQAPDPLTMPNGVYSGSLILSVGAGDEDISLGNGSYSDNQLVINVTLTVRHQLKVNIPSGYESISLKPPGGWGEWLNGGRVPPILKESMPFDIAASSTFRVSYMCDYSIGEQCALQNSRNGHLVTLDMFYLTPPSTRSKLPLDVTVSALQQGWMHRAISFEVSSDNVKAMVQYPGSTYKGAVTLVFDALP